MTVPMWAPFLTLAAVCALTSRTSRRRVDWYRVGAYTACLAYCLAVWAVVALAVWWLVW